jgi:pimeloyl-ACP methyl ester carboxylesterase
MRKGIHHALLLVIVGSIGAHARTVTAQALPRRAMFGAAVVGDPAGVRVTAVVPGGPAATAGLKVGDVITAFGDRKVDSPSSFVADVRVATVERPVAVKALRAGVALTLHVRLIPAPEESDALVDTLYSSIEVDGTLRRTLLTTPKRVSGRLPAMLLIGGIGCFTVDNPSDPYDTYRLLAHDLTRAGIAVLRLEKAGIGDSQGGPCFDTDFDQELGSYAAALIALRSEAHVDSNRIFLFGHSIGTMIAPILASRYPVAGVIAADGVGINWVEYELANLRRQAALEGDSPAQTDALLRSKEICMHRLLIERQPESAIEADMPECKERNAYPVAASYLQQVAALNIGELWMKVNVPVLAIYGTADFVTSQADLQRIVDIVRAGHPGIAELRLIEGMDHHFERMGTAQNAYDTRVKQHSEAPYDEQLSDVVKQWICRKTS